MKFKPKLDKMQEKVVAQRLEEQQMKQKQQQQASQKYMKNVTPNAFKTIMPFNCNITFIYLL